MFNELVKFDINSLLYSLYFELNAQKNVSIFDTSFGQRSWLVNDLNKKFVYVVESFDLQNKLKKQFESMGKKVDVIYSVDFDLKPSTFKNDESRKQLISSLYNIATDKVDAVIISPKVLMQRVPSLLEFKKHIVSLEVGKDYNLNDIKKTLIESNYQKVEMVESQGQFAIRGDILDVFSLDEELPFRIEFFGNQVESINSFNVQNYSKATNYQKVSICPNTLIFIENNSQMIDTLDKNFRLVQNKLDSDNHARLKTVLEEVKFKLENYSYSGIENYVIPLLNYADNILSFLPKNFVVIFDDVKHIYDKISFCYDEFKEQFDLLQTTFDAYNFHKNLIVDSSKVFACSNQKISFQNINTSNKIFNPQSVFSFKPSSVTNFYGNYNQILEEVKYYLEFGYTLILYAKNNETAIHLKNFLEKENQKVLLISDVVTAQPKVVNILPQTVCYGAVFVEDKICLLGTDELFGKQEAIKQTKKTKREVFTLPKIGDYVVHEKFGIGKCVGIERRKFSSFEKDYIVLEYAGGDKLYVPTEQIDLIASYVSSNQNQKLSKLGTQEFERVKQKVRSSVKEMAFSLLNLYARRQQLKGYKYAPDDEVMKAFENSFIYDETQDQLEAIKQIKSDMENGKLMDRLVCGDVGYGKTEVALRAIFKAVCSGKQVAFLAPTTILSQQHYNTCYSRMHKFMVHVEVLNRFKSAKEQRQILNDLKDGKIDVIVGTHRLLSKDVEFKDLGLLVLDEEQRFGVQDKEKIKNLKNNIDVLTLSATPIPRTLHMSLSGIRDISLITTAPEGRLPVQTTVTEYSDILAKEVLTRELNRGGQAIVVYNSIEHIYSLAEKIRSFVGADVTVGVAHGQMDEKTLENEIFKLYNGETKILVSTTLIENGIDLPNANTLLVLNADRLGLSQLYQLRGRVGRGNKLGYAYFTYEKNKVMTEDAYKRLNALMEFTELGSGFKIAMRDLEIRGCGNVMGKEQHGHMDKVGYDMYCKLLNQAIAEIKGEKIENKRDVKIDVAINAFIPHDYIVDSDSRFRVYNNLISIKSSEDREKVISEIKQVYGKNLPAEVDNLSKISLLRYYSQKIGISKVSINSLKASVTFYDKQTLLSEKITNCLQSLPLQYVLNFNDMPTINLLVGENTCGTILDILLNFLANCQNKNS